jgi:DNA-binding winged helix-turn-helix (wHTH) protein/predicted ATPase
MQDTKEITFGQFRLDLTNECLWQGHRSIALRPKAYAVLKLLLAHPAQLVSKQQVLDTVWPGTFVGDAVLKDSIRQLREALDDDAGSPTYIETAHRRGYRFIGKLSEPPQDGNLAASILQSAAPIMVRVARQTPSAAVIGMLGREAESSRMRAWLDRALQGVRQTIFITGEPGIGKTTIVQSILEDAGKIPGIRIIRGQCMEHYGAGEAYLPVLDGFSRLCKSPEETQVLDLLRRQAPTWLSQMPSVLPQLERDTLQSQFAGATRERMLREMAEVIETLSSDCPLLLVLEDLHWSDYSTLDLVSYLARRRDSARLMIIGTYRPVDVIVAEHPLKEVKRELQAHGLCRELALESLSEETVAEYLSERFPGHQFPARLTRTVYQRTEGTPLFLVNLVEYLIDRKAIIQEQGIWKLHVDLSEVEREVPFNVRELIQKQIERLSPDERIVLEAASVAGMECSCVAIAAGLDEPLEWVEKHCEELARRHRFLTPAWLVDLPNGTVTPRHRFIHVLYRDVPYRSMAPLRRSQIHQRIAERGIAIYGDRVHEIAAELAMHFEESHDWQRAGEYILQAAESAATRSAHHEASDLANRGLEALKFLNETAERAKQEMKLRMILSVSLMAIKGFASPEVETINARGRELFWRHGPSPELFYMLRAQNFYQQFSGDLRSALEVSYQLVQLAHDLNDEALMMEAHQSLGALLVILGRCSEALDHLEKGSALYGAHHHHRTSPFGSFDSKVMFDSFAALAYLELGYPDRSAERLAAALSHARKLGHAQTLVVALHIASLIHYQRCEVSAVYEHAKEAMELADEYGFAVWQAYGLIEVGWAVAELGNPQDGIDKMRRGLAEYEATGAKLWCSYFLGMLAGQLGKTGRIEEGLQAISSALSLADRTGEGYSLPDFHRIKGDLYVKSGELNRTGNAPNPLPRSTVLSQARTCFAQSIAIARQHSARWWELRAAICLYRLDLMLGNPGSSQLEEIYSSFTEGFLTADLEQAQILLRQCKD